MAVDARVVRGAVERLVVVAAGQTGEGPGLEVHEHAAGKGAVGL